VRSVVAESTGEYLAAARPTGEDAVMKAILITAPGRTELVDVPEPRPRPRDVVIQVAAAGICGTDLHILDGEYAPSLPITPGHEFAGRVAEVGEDVAELSVGDLVAADPNIPCRECFLCRTGRDNLCERAEAIGVTVPGAMAELVAVPAANCVRLPAATSLDEAALIEPLSCAVHAFDVIRPRLAQSYLILGAGTMGSLMIQLARVAGARSVDVVDPNRARLGSALATGADRAVPSTESLGTPAGYEVVIDCSGVAAAIQDGITRVARGGLFLFFGVSSDEAVIELRPQHVLMNEITLIGSRAVLHSFERAAQLFLAGTVDLSTLVTDVYPLAEFDAAARQFREGRGRKVLVRPT
jgi:2-desacetyl-2-hydroxyethyl bacteriochlorophyllide A dehydrogenase